MRLFNNMYPTYKRKMKQHLSILLVLVLICQLLVGCSSGGGEGSQTGTVIGESEISEQFLNELRLDEQQLEASYIIENVIFEDGMYEYKINENIISQVYLIETVISETTEKDIKLLLPEEIDDYDIDWPRVIGKFAIGTSVIIAVGVVNYFTTSTFFVFGSPITVAKDALIGGAIGMTLNEVIACAKEGKNVQKTAKKYAVEGFAEGFMWGAISSVLKIFSENFKRLEKFKLTTGGALKIKADGSVFDDAGKLIGEAVYGKDGTWYLWNRSSKTVLRAFDSTGKELTGAALQGMSNLPANEKLRLGTDSAAQICYTDDNGQVMRIGKSLEPNMDYVLNGYTYSTDNYGRIVEANFSDLQLKNRDRLSLGNLSLNDVGRGAERVTDDKGHLIADMFNGDNSVANIVPMDKNVNRAGSEFYQIETELMNCLQQGGHANGAIKIAYSGSSFRPESFIYSYDIGNGLVSTFIPNG